MRSIVFSRRNELLRVPLKKAMFFESYGNYCYGVFPNKQKVMLPVGLAQVEQLICSEPEVGQPVFIRIGKRFIVNTDIIVQVNISSQRLVLTMTGSYCLTRSADALLRTLQTRTISSMFL